jgi:oligopeptidase A
LATLAANAEAKGVQGYRITLDFPSFYPVLTFADDRELRREVYTAFVTRASDQGPNAGEYDNAPVIEETLRLRRELAELLGFASYADLSLATKMAESPRQVLDFLEDLARRAVPQAREEFAELEAYARDTLGMNELAPWDIGYVSEKLREARHAISQEQLRPYFPAPRVVDGLFQVVERLYGVTFEEDERRHATTRRCAISASWSMTNQLPASTSTCMPGRASAAVPGWTSAGCAAATRTAACSCRWPT